MMQMPGTIEVVIHLVQAQFKDLNAHNCFQTEQAIVLLFVETS